MGPAHRPEDPLHPGRLTPRQLAGLDQATEFPLQGIEPFRVDPPFRHRALDRGQS